MSRLEANRKILEKIAEVIETYPDWRFHQILQNIGCSSPGADQWFEESKTTLARIDHNACTASN